MDKRWGDWTLQIILVIWEKRGNADGMQSETARSREGLGWLQKIHLVN